MTALLDRVERELGSAWVETVEWLRDQNQLDDVEQRVHAGDYEGAIVGVEDAAARFAASAQTSYVEAGEAAASWLDAQVPTNLVTFDVANPRALRWAQMNKLDAISEISQEQREVLNGILSRNAGAAVNPLEYARDVRAAIGLTSKQEAHVATYRVKLETGDLRGALDRELADGRYDRSLLAAIRDGREIPEDQIDRMVESYRANWVTYRGRVIARTEGLRVIHQGTEELFQQAVDDGVIDIERLVQQWNSHRDSHTRRSHYVMDGQLRRFGESFESGEGVELRFPGDPNAPAAETAQCRCNRSMRLLSVEAARDLLAAAA